MLTQQHLVLPPLLNCTKIDQSSYVALVQMIGLRKCPSCQTTMPDGRWQWKQWGAYRDSITCLHFYSVQPY